MKKIKSNSAITLIALIITIIVLLILAGVTLSMVMGENGIFGKANSAKEKTQKTTAEETTVENGVEETTVISKSENDEDAETTTETTLENNMSVNKKIKRFRIFCIRG